MKACLIRLEVWEEVKQFYSIVSQVPYEVRVTGGPRTVNANLEMDVFPQFDLSAGVGSAPR